MTISVFMFPFLGVGPGVTGRGGGLHGMSLPRTLAVVCHPLYNIYMSVEAALFFAQKNVHDMRCCQRNCRKTAHFDARKRLSQPACGALELKSTPMNDRCF